MNKFSIFSFRKIINKIWIIKFEALCHVLMKYGLNKIKIKLFIQQMGWVGGKRIELCPWSLKIKLHNWHLLWFTLEYWPNILYLPILPKLGGYLTRPKYVDKEVV